MCAVLKNLFFNSKLDLFLVQIFMKIGLTELKVITISLDMGKSKWQISEKKALKLPKYQNRISQELFRVWWKKFCSLLFLIRRNIWAKFDQNLRGWVTKLKILSLFDKESPTEDVLRFYNIQTIASSKPRKKYYQFPFFKLI